MKLQQRQVYLRLVTLLNTIKEIKYQRNSYKDYLLKIQDSSIKQAADHRDRSGPRQTVTTGGTLISKLSR